MGRNFKDSKSSFSILRKQFWGISIPRLQKCIHFRTFQLQARIPLQIQIIPKSKFSTIFNSRPEFSRNMDEISKTQKANFQSCGCRFEAFSAPRPPKVSIFKTFSAADPKNAPDSFERHIFEHFQQKYYHLKPLGLEVAKTFVFLRHTMQKTP